MTAATASNRCRILLTLDIDRVMGVDNIAYLAKVSDIASVILYKGTGDFSCQQKLVGALVEIFQAQGVAVMIAGDSQMAGRLKTDGLHIEGDLDDFYADKLSRNTKMILGVGGIKTRHKALEVGEKNPDYVMFGKLGGDKKAKPHPRNIALGTWWASMVEIPCIVQAGADVETLAEIVETGAEFVALEEAIFGASDMMRALERASQILDIHASLTSEATQ